MNATRVGAPVDRATCDELARLGTATVYEAYGRKGLIDVQLDQLVPGSRAAGPARIAACARTTTGPCTR